MELQKISLVSEQDGLVLDVLTAKPEDTPKAVVQIVHGMSEHKERYLPFMEYLCGHGYACVIHDHRGHGASIRNKDDLGYLYGKGAEYLTEDMHQVTSYAKQVFPELPVLLFGHSMGSMVVRASLKSYDNELAGLIVCGSPSYNAASGIGRLLAKAIGTVKGDHTRSKFLQLLSFGAFSKKHLKDGSTNSWICTVREEVQAYDDGPLCGFVFTANGFYHLYGLMREAYGKKGWQVKNPALPIRFISGADDPCLISEKKFQKAVAFLQDRGYTDVTSRLYAGKRHELLNEDIRTQVFRDIREFWDICLAENALRRQFQDL